MLTLILSCILVSHIDMYVYNYVPLYDIPDDDECDGGASHQEPGHAQQNGIDAYLHSCRDETNVTV